MGQRANIIVTQQGRTEIFYTHWRANTLPGDLFWGPHFAAAFARSQKMVQQSDLLDEVWAEGGAIIDLDHRLLVLFGGEDLSYEVPTRRLFLRLLKCAWPGWDVRWAYEGVCDLADYLGISRSKVLTEQKHSLAAPFVIADPPSDAATIASVKALRGQLMLFPTYVYVEDHLSGGPDLLEMNRGGGVAEIQIAETVPISGGFHIDEALRSIEIWTAADAPNITERVATSWPGWSVKWYQDRFEFQIERTDGRFNFTTQAQEQLLRQIREMLLREETVGAVDRFLQVTEIISKEGMEINDINPLALRDARLTLPMDLRIQTVDRAIAAL